MAPKYLGGRTMKITKEKTLTIVTFAMAAMFLMSGGMKFMAPPEMVENFVRWGYAEWFIYVIGTVEVGAALLLALPATRVVGALVLAVTMIGAAATHLLAGEYLHTFPALVLLAGLTTVLFANRAQIIFKLQTVTARFL
jgi:putative oxidoreductase